MPKSNERSYKRTIIPALLLGLGAGATGGVVAHELTKNSMNGTIEAVRQDGQRADAQRVADSLGGELGRAGKDVSAELQVWSGVIARKTDKGTVYIGDPIVLTRGDTSGASPTAVESSPSYYGVVEALDGKNFRIVPYAFTEDDTYTPYDNDENWIRTVDTYISTAEQSSGDMYYQAFAFDPAGESTVVNTDGSLLSPGLILPQDRK